jgi:hypothetical protein
VNRVKVGALVLFHTLFGRILVPLVALRWIATGGRRAFRIEPAPPPDPALQQGALVVHERTRRVRLRAVPTSARRRALLALGLAIAIALLALGVRTLREWNEFAAGAHARGRVVSTEPIGPGSRVRARVKLATGATVTAEDFDLARDDEVTAFRNRHGVYEVDDRAHYDVIGTVLVVLGALLVPGPVLALFGRQLVLVRSRAAASRRPT